MTEDEATHEHRPDLKGLVKYVQDFGLDLEGHREPLKCF